MTVSSTLTGPDPGPTLTLSPARNRAQWGHSEPHRFNRRWEVHMLALLLERARLHQPLLASDLNAHLMARGQNRPLNRSQVQRLVLSLSAWLDELPGRPWALEHAPRKLSVGPWFLTATGRTPVDVHLDTEGDSPLPAARQSLTMAHDPAHGPGRSLWPSPLIVDLPGSDTDTVLQRLAAWTAQTLVLLEAAAPGARSIAHTPQRLDAWLDGPLTPEARICQGLLRLQWWRQRDEGPLSRRRVEARQALEALEALLPHARRDLGLIELVRVQGLLNLLLFDPGLHASHVLQESQHPGPLLSGSGGLAQWHRLRVQAGWLQAGQPGLDADSAATLHATSALHLEGLLYWSLQTTSPDGLRTATALAQQHLPLLHARGLCSASTVSAWRDAAPSASGRA
ncbi:hypothetical protein [Amphibiibacter pelophylacis]|uniref:Uncharacterized protein n=1 Tax=Amphibiibacter pelophylacis TaxID=1799477 RepID=A0ACC6P0R2_9BURK